LRGLRAGSTRNVGFSYSGLTTTRLRVEAEEVFYGRQPMKSIQLITQFGVFEILKSVERGKGLKAEVFVRKDKNAVAVRVRNSGGRLVKNVEVLTPCVVMCEY